MSTGSTFPFRIATTLPRSWKAPSANDCRLDEGGSVSWSAAKKAPRASEPRGWRRGLTNIDEGRRDAASDPTYFSFFENLAVSTEDVCHSRPETPFMKA